MKPKYRFSDDEIVFYPLRILQMFAVLFGILYVLTAGAILWMSYSLNGEINTEKLLFPLLLLFIFPAIFHAGNKQLIFSKRDEILYKSRGFMRKEVARFSEISSIQYVEDENGYHVFLKSNPYGKGIGLVAISASTERAKFEMECLPILKQIIFKENDETKAEMAINFEELKYYTRSSNIFKVKNYLNAIWGLFLALLATGLFVWAGIVGDQQEFRFIPIPVFLAGFYMGSRRCFFDISNDTFNTSAFFFVKKTYDLAGFVNIRVVRNSSYGVYDHTSVELVFNDEKGKLHSVKLRDFHGTGKIEGFIDETKAVMGI